MPRLYAFPVPKPRLPYLLASFALASALTACSSDDNGGDDVESGAGAAAGGAPAGGAPAGGAPAGGADPTGAGTAGTTPGGGGSSNGLLGTFIVALNPAVEDSPPYTSIFGKVYSGPYPTDVIETEIASDSNCTVYKYSLQACFEPQCTGNQVCVAQNVCEARPSLVSVGDVAVDGIGASSLKLSVVNNNYQYPLDLPYPGVTEGQAVSLTASGGAFSGFTISTVGVSPVALTESSYLVSNNQPLTVRWTPGAASAGAEVALNFNISKHGGSAGYMQCTTTDSGELTIPANLLQELVGLGVGGFPELLVTRSTRAETTVSAGKIALEVQALAKPALNIEGYCSCFNDSDCGSCTDKTKTSCDSVRKLCKAP